MNFFQRIGNALSRFMYGRNGVDRLGLTMIWTAILLDLINMFLRESQPRVYSIISLASGILMLWTLFRMFSRIWRSGAGERTVHGEGLVAGEPAHRRKPPAADGQGAPVLHLPQLRRGVPRTQREGAHRHHLPRKS